MITNLDSLILDKNKYYYLCAASLGDTMLTCGFLNALEKKYDAEIILLLSEKQKFIAEMYGISNYIVVSFDKKCLNQISDENPLPQKGKIFVAHPAFHKELKEFFNPIFYQNSTIRFVPWFKRFLGLPKDTQLEQPIHYPLISEDLKKKCEKIGPIEKIVIFSPEATSMTLLTNSFWENKVQETIDAGLIPVSNVINPKNTIKGSVNLNLTIEECVALSQNCNSVHSIRSGLCDLLFKLGKKLNVYYPTFNAFYLYSLNKMFDRDDINEKICSDKLKVNNESSELLEKFYLFGLIPFFEIKTKMHKKYYKLFGILIIKKVRK